MCTIEQWILHQRQQVTHRGDTYDIRWGLLVRGNAVRKGRNISACQVFRSTRNKGEDKRQGLRVFPHIFLRHSLVQYDPMGFAELETGSRVWLPQNQIFP